MADPRLRGQEVAIKLVENGALVNEINSIASFNDNTNFAINEQGFLGEPVNRFDMILNGYSGDFEWQPSNSDYYLFVQALEDKARRVRLVTINIIRTDLFANGSSAIVTYRDCSFGPVGTSIGSRSDYAKLKTSFSTSTRDIKLNQI